MDIFKNYEVEGQISLFDLTMENFKIAKPIRLIELFAGVGSQAMALRDLGADFEHYRVVEFDKYAIASYNAIHGTDFKPMDVTKISGLLWEVERLLNEVENLPQVLLMENVPQVHGKKNMDDFQRWIDYLASRGYSNYWQDLNAKNYGVAQNRNRCFMVSILGNYKYDFPKPIELTKRMKDYLEDEVDEKYYINNEKAQKLIDTLIANGTILDRQTDRQSTCQLTSREKSIQQTASKQDMMPESAISKQMEAVLLKSQASEFERFTDVANTLMARDYKGFGNQGMNGVIEWK